VAETIRFPTAHESCCPCSEWNGWGRLGTLATLVFKAISLAARPGCSALTRAYPRRLGESLCGVGALALVACAPMSHEDPANLPAIEPPSEPHEPPSLVPPREDPPVPPAEPLPSPPYRLIADASLTSEEAAHVRHAGQLMSAELGGPPAFVWHEGAPEGCDYVLVTRSDETRLLREGCAWVVELAEGGEEGDLEVLQLVRALFATVGPGAP
jgi:hypothetical protein